MNRLRYRNYGLDFMKFIAAIFITNSHFIPIYKDVNVGLATLGVHGNALFFFVAGFLLIAGFQTNENTFGNWFKKRIQRLWPAVFLWTLIVSIVWNDTLTWQKIVVAPEYWFLQCIVIFYAIYYFVGKRMLNRGGNWRCFLSSVLVSVVYAFLMPKSAGSIFHSSWHYVCHFSVMVLGGLAFIYKDKIKKEYFFMDLIWLGFSFIAYFAVMAIGKGQTDWKYYIQIIALIPLHTFCWFFYKVCSYSWCDKIFLTKRLRWPFITVSSLTLEIYIVQFHIITDKYNSLFPISWIIVFAQICFAAYLLRVCVNVFIQFMRKEDWNWSAVIHL